MAFIPTAEKNISSGYTDEIFQSFLKNIKMQKQSLIIGKINMKKHMSTQCLQENHSMKKL